MLTVTYLKHGIRLSHIWFATAEQIENGSFFRHAGDLAFLHGVGAATVVGRKPYTKQHTVIKELQLPTEELFQTLGKHLRQYINRSKREGLVRISILDSKRILCEPEVLRNCKDIFEKMYSDKGLEERFNSVLAKKYCDQDALVIAMAYCNETPVGFSAVVYQGCFARLWLTAFDFRNENHDAQVLSRGHQQLDWELILWLKAKGVESFDLGGINSFDEPNGIARFKMSFERENRVTYYNYLIPKTLLGRIALRFLQTM